MDQKANYAILLNPLRNRKKNPEMDMISELVKRIQWNPEKNSHKKSLSQNLFLLHTGPAFCP